jgi:hypothetical protein
MSVAFALKESYADKDFHGGELARHDGTSWNVSEELEKGKGYIVVEHPSDIEQLSNYEALKRSSVAEAEKAVEEKPAKVADAKADAKNSEGGGDK